MYAQNLPPSRKLGVWEISPIFSAYGDGLPSSLRLGSSYEEKNDGGGGYLQEKLAPVTGQPTRMPLGCHWDDLDFKAAEMAVEEDVAHDWDSIISNKI